MHKTQTKSKIAGNTPRTPRVRSATPRKATTPAKPTNAADALVAAMRESGGDISAAVHEAEVMLAIGLEHFDGYTGLVSDNGTKVRDSDIGRTDMDVTATVARIALTSVAMLQRLLAGREARAMAVAVETANRLCEGTRAVFTLHQDALKNCIEAIERGSAPHAPAA